MRLKGQICSLVGTATGVCLSVALLTPVDEGRVLLVLATLLGAAALFFLGFEESRGRETEIETETKEG